MKILSIVFGSHDDNVAMAVDRKVRYAKFERIKERKHATAGIWSSIEMCKEWNCVEFDAVAIVDLGILTRGIGVNLGVTECFKEQNEPFIEIFRNLGIKAGSVFYLDHHYAHALSAFPIVPTHQVDYGIAIDGMGRSGKRKQVMTGLASKEPEILDFSREPQFTKVMRDIGLALELTGMKYDYAGKVMGLQSYGTVDMDVVNNWEMDKISERPELLVHDRWGDKAFFNVNSRCFRNWLATVHHGLDIANVYYFKEKFESSSTISYSGGGVQNTVFNQTLYEHFPNLHFTPHGYDGGLALGGLEFLRIYHDQPEFDVAGFPFWQHDVMNGAPSDETIEKVVELLEQGKNVGWYQGRGEVGPRALGHRSILMDPRIREAKKILNEKVKKREWFRPFAASILESAVGKYFEDDRPSPHMMRCVPAKEGVKEIVPSVIHVDNTCRLQTVLDDWQDPFAVLLKEWYRRTNMPMLLNTSLNFKSGPILGDSSRALELFDKEGIDAICVGDEFRVK